MSVFTIHIPMFTHSEFVQGIPNPFSEDKMVRLEISVLLVGNN